MSLPALDTQGAVSSLVVVDGPEPGERFVIRPGGRSYVVGRGEMADVQIEHDTVSRAHATITVDEAVGRGRTAVVIDLDSQNGTFVNGVRIESAILMPGDRLQLGFVVLRFELVDAADLTYVAHRRVLGTASSSLPDDTASFSRALASLWLAFQPIVSTAERRLVGWEALLRNDEPSLVRPDHLLATAERLGRVHDVGRAVRSLAASFVDDLPGDTYLSVNLHPVDLEDAHLVDPRAPLSQVAHRVILEITERASIEKLDDLERRIRELRALGYRIAIDDVGAGYAGLGTIARILPDVLKVDRSIVHEVQLSPIKAKVLRSLAALCADLGMAMVLEGVETEEERAAASEVGCDLMQGYLFARPSERAPSNVASM